jgi:glutaredoxin
VKEVAMATLAYRITLGIAAVTFAGGAFAQTQVYRYTDADGRVVYSDRAPSGDVKNLQTKKLGANYISTSEPGYASAHAAERYPVTLYTFACGDVCQNAEALLNKRGVPFAIVNVGEQEGQTRLKAVASEGVAPVLTVGDKLVAKGYDEARWQAMLDEAGYPKTPALRRVVPVGRGSDAATPPPIAQDGTRAPSAPPRGGDYPK